MSDVLHPAVWQVFDANGDPVAGAKARFYETGTTTAKTVYADQALTTPHAIPLVADGNGVMPAVFSAGGNAKAVVTTSAGAALYTVDPVQRVLASGSTAAAIAFAPTVEIPETDVQAAIETVQANIVAPLAAFGLGVTGSTTLLADIDATTTASGSYRFDGTTAGTFPSGVTKANGGTIRIVRETSTKALQLLTPTISTDIYIRRLSGIFSAWRKLIDEDDVLDEDSMASNSATKVASQQSIVAYVAANAFGQGAALTSYTSPTRQVSTAYENTSGVTREVYISGTASNISVQLSPDGVTYYQVGILIATNLNVHVTVPPGFFYRVNGAATINTWVEVE